MKKLLIFSDTHLTHKFDQKKFTFLKNLIENADQVIINGDFWDNAFTTFDKFVNSKWQDLFPILKDRNTIYLYGNHDLPHQTDERVNLFSIKQVEEYKIKIGKYLLSIAHGHKHSRFTRFWYKFFGNYPKLLRYISLPMGFIFELNEFLTRKTNKSLFSIFNRTNKSKVAKYMAYNEVFIAGHTHAPEFNLDRKYINLGFIRQGFASYVVATADNIQYVRCQY